MAESNLCIRVVVDNKSVYSDTSGDTLEIGRQQFGEIGPFSINRDATPNRLIVAPIDARSVSRKHVELKRKESGIEIRNVSKVAELQIRMLPAGRIQTLSAGEIETFASPFSIEIGSCQINVEANDFHLDGLGHVTLPPSVFAKPLSETLATPALQKFRSPDQMDGPELMNWLRNIVDLFQRSPGEEFFEESTAVVAQMLKLDSAAILFRRNKQWEVKHLYQTSGNRSQPNNGDDWRPSMTILNAVCRDVRAYRQMPNEDQPMSLMNVNSLVAAPILSVDGEVVGALYGDRRSQVGGDISEVETMFVELLASGLAAGLARIEKEKQIVQARVRFEQFFPTGLVERLEADQDFLKGKDSEVTVMFCDIRKFSQISERVGPETTVEFISDALQQLSECVMENNGVLVDYIADELIAMWGAPDLQVDHAELATRAGQEMISRVPALNDRWKDRIGTEFEIGVGLNSGIAQVGNIGSKLRFKYGPLGNPVNIASRVQGVTKQLKIPYLVTLDTASRLGDSIQYRKLCQVQLVNVAQPVMVCEIPRHADESWKNLKSSYEEGLELFEQSRFLEACDQLSATLKQFPGDHPTMKLLSRAVMLLSDGDAGPDQIVWKLDSK